MALLFGHYFSPLHIRIQKKNSIMPARKFQKKLFIMTKKTKYGCGKWMGTYFPTKNFTCSKAGKIEDFENWVRDKEPVDSIEDVTSYKVH